MSLSLELGGQQMVPTMLSACRGIPAPVSSALDVSTPILVPKWQLSEITNIECMTIFAKSIC